MSRIEEALERAGQLRDNEVRDLPPRMSGKGMEAELKTIQEPIPKPPVSLGDSSVANPYLVVINDPQSPVAEEYKKLKEAVIKVTNQNGFKNMIVVTSSLPGEGKSVTAINLALCIAQEYDHTVLLVDADLRKPSCARYLGIVEDKGLTDCLLSGVDIGEVLLRTGIGKLSLLPAGRRAPNPAELFSSRSTRELFQEMKLRYPDRYIIIDTPPVLPFAETRSIASMADGVLMVVKEGLPSQANIVDSIDALKGTNILGLIYNSVEVSGPRRSQYYNYSHYNYGQNTK
jgi:protein-tyrosine kinase